MNDRHAERVGEMFLGDRRRKACPRREADVAGAGVEMQDQIGDLLDGDPPPDAEEILVEGLLLARGKPGDVEGKGWFW